MSKIRELANELGKSWEEIFGAEDHTTANYKVIRNQFSTIPLPITSTDADLIVFGSIARNECTAKSDVDWTLIVDGQANSNHLDIAHFIEDGLIKTGLAEPGKSGMFGQITFSHDLIHYIGGQDDTNHNLSRRILLLLESALVLTDKLDGTAYERVIRGVIGKYIDNDSGFNASGKENVPRFLLNDIIRFWRTMCVDFAYKQIEQKGQKWALRNIKLRMARRLIFVKGLLMCTKLYGTSASIEQIKDNLYTFVAQKPLEFMVSTFLEFGVSPQQVSRALDSYNTYLCILNDHSLREHLSQLDMHQAYGDAKFEAARRNSHLFQEVLDNVFLKDDNKIKEFTTKYGVF